MYAGVVAIAFVTPDITPDLVFHVFYAKRCVARIVQIMNNSCVALFLYLFYMDSFLYCCSIPFLRKYHSRDDV